MTFTILMIIIAVLILLGLVIAIIAAKKRPKIPDKNGKYPEGHFIGQWMGIGVALGIPFGVSMGNISLGLPIGLAIGVAIGSVKEKEAKKKGLIRPLTKEEQKLKKKTMIAAISLLGLGFIAGIVIFFLSQRL